MKKNIFLVLAIALALPTVTYTYPYNNRPNPAIRALILTGSALSITALLAAGGYFLHKFIAGENTQKIYASAERLYQEMRATYPPYRLEENLTESDLSRLSKESSEIQQAMQAAGDYTKLSLMRIMLERRTEQAKFTNDTLVSSMQELADKMKALEVEISAYDHFWQNHGDYFKTKEYIDQLTERYSMLDATERSVRHSIAQEVQSSMDYPFFTYVNELQKNSKQLSLALETASSYPQLYARMQRLADRLKSALVIAFNFPEYRQEVQFKKQNDLVGQTELDQVRAAYEQAKMEQNQIRLEQERQAIEKEREQLRQQREEERLQQERQIAQENARLEQERQAIEKEKAQLEQKLQQEREQLRQQREEERLQQERQIAQENARLEQERQAIEKEKAQLEQKLQQEREQLRQQKEEERLQQERQIAAQEKARLEQERQAVTQEKARLEQERINQQQLYKPKQKPATTYEAPVVSTPSDNESDDYLSEIEQERIDLERERKAMQQEREQLQKQKQEERLQQERQAVAQEKARLEQERKAIKQERERLRKQKEEELLRQERDWQAAAQEKARREQERINQQQRSKSRQKPATIYQRSPAYNPAWDQTDQIEAPALMDDESDDYLGD